MGAHPLYSVLSWQGHIWRDGFTCPQGGLQLSAKQIKLACSPSQPDGRLKLTASAFNQLGQYACSLDYRDYCCAELAVSSLAMAVTTASTHFTIPQKVEG